MVPPQFTALQRPHPIPTDRKRSIGRARLRLLQVSAEPLRKEFGAVPLLSCTGRQLSARRMGRVLGFIIAFISLTLPLFQSKVNNKRQSQHLKLTFSFAQQDALSVLFLQKTPEMVATSF